jgi:hypothetical protein
VYFAVSATPGERHRASAALHRLVPGHEPDELASSLASSAGRQRED